MSDTWSEARILTACNKCCYCILKYRTDKIELLEQTKWWALEQMLNIIESVSDLLSNPSSKKQYVNGGRVELKI